LNEQGFGSWLSSKWKKITTLASTVAAATKSIVQTAADIISGNIDSSTSAVVTFVDYNYDTGTGHAVEEFDLAEALGITTGNVVITCTECYAYAATSLVLTMSIQSYSLKTAEVYVTGDAKFKMALQGSLEDVTYNWEKEVS
jgi:nickel-dependent lactate racemase